ncbi:MAG: DSD1 family PLP-dependent enzyme [Candidatus Methanomethyliaceae archaeon]
MSFGTEWIGRPAWDLDTPALLVDLAAMERNIVRTANVLRQAGVNWRPHIKSQKVPAIAHREIAAGAIGVTCAKLGEAEVMVNAGIRNVLIANQIVGAQKIARLVQLCRHAEVIVAVDSLENALELSVAAKQAGVRISVVVEVDTGLERCGVKPGEPAVMLSQKIHECEGLRYMGLMAWEGPARRCKDPEERRKLCEKLVRPLTWTAHLCREAGLPVEIVSCGGTGTEEFSSRIPGVTEIQAGGIVFHDMYYSALGVDREFALTILSTVISRPSPTRIVTDAGRKAMSGELALPVPKGLTGVKAVVLTAEHSKIELEKPNLELKIGDKVEWIVGFADGTVHLHDEMYGVRDGIVEVVWPVPARSTMR